MIIWTDVLLRGDQQMDKNLVLKTKITIDMVDTVLKHTKGDGGTTFVGVQTLISFTVLECIGVVGQAP
jgi:hypothetical protein